MRYLDDEKKITNETESVLKRLTSECRISVQEIEVTECCYTVAQQTLQERSAR